MRDMDKIQRTAIAAPLRVRSIITVYHKKLAPDHYSDERHDFPELVFVEQGKTACLLNGQTTRFEAGQAVLYGPYTRHQTAEPPQQATVNVISFEADWPEDVDCFDRVLTLTPRQRRQLSQVVSEGLELFDPAWTRQGSWGMAPHPGVSAFELQRLRLQLELLLIDLLLGGSDPGRGNARVNRENYKKEQFDRLTDHLKANLGEDLTLEQISRHCGMSPSALRRLCQEQCGCAPMAYFTSLRLVRARRLIRESSMNFTQIAQELGFHTAQYFSRQFKEKTGMSPSDYARSVDRGER